MTRTELIVRTHERLPEMTLEQVMACCNIFVENIGDALAAGHSVSLPKFGTFDIKKHRASSAQSQRTERARQAGTQ